MPRPLVLVACICLATFASPSLAQVVAHPENQPEKAATPKAAHDQPDDVAALKADLQRMQATVYQMQTNLAFVGSTTTPLYHEFELDIQMWQTMIAQMQRRVERLEKKR